MASNCLGLTEEAICFSASGKKAVQPSALVLRNDKVRANSISIRVNLQLRVVFTLKP